jgi:aryl-alcohol dehydrogenase-like predicted oxidoreductase
MMNYQLLGKTGLRVADFCLGTMTFGDDWGWGAAKDEARKIYDYYREQGGNFIDTANLYTDGTSEKFLGEFISGHRSGSSWPPNTPMPPQAKILTQRAIIESQ